MISVDLGFKEDGYIDEGNIDDKMTRNIDEDIKTSSDEEITLMNHLNSAK